MARSKHPKPTYEAHVASRRASGLDRMLAAMGLRAEREMEVCPKCGGYVWHPMIDSPGILDDDECCDCD